MKRLAKKLLHPYIYNFVRMRPRIVVISSSLWLKIKRLNRAAWLEHYDVRGDYSSYLLKYTHMLDKGLQRIDRAPGHSFGLIKHVRGLLDKRGGELPRKHVLWAEDLLLKHGHLQENRLEYCDDKRISKGSLMSLPDLIELVKNRRSIRHYSSVTPSAEDLLPALDLIPWAPSSCNRQTTRIFLVEDSDLVSKCVAQNKGATGLSGNFLFVSVCYDSRSYHLPQESLTGYIDASLAFQNFLLGVHALGYGATVLNWSHADKFEETNLRELLGLESYHEVVMNCVVGIISQKAPVPSKKTIEEFVTLI